MERAPKQKWKMPIFNEYLKNEDSGKRRRRNVRQAGWVQRMVSEQPKEKKSSKRTEWSTLPRAAQGIFIKFTWGRKASFICSIHGIYFHTTIIPTQSFLPH